MRNGIFFFGRYLGKRKRAAENIGIKQRIITKAAFSCRCMSDASLKRSPRNGLRTILVNEHQSAYETSRPLLVGNIGKCRKQLLVVFRIACILARVSGREHPGCPVQGIHLKPRIIGKRRTPSLGLMRRMGLDARVSQKAVRILRRS